MLYGLPANFYCHGSFIFVQFRIFNGIKIYYQIAIIKLWDSDRRLKEENE